MIGGDGKVRRGTKRDCGQVGRGVEKLCGVYV